MATENQHVENESFQAWSVETGQWGGRAIDVPDVTSPTSCTRPEPRIPSATSLLDWVASSEASPFTVYPPDSLTNSVQTVLLQDNAHHAREHVQARLDDPTTTQSVSRSDVKVHTGEGRGWSVGPTQAVTNSSSA